MSQLEASIRRVRPNWPNWCVAMPRRGRRSLSRTTKTSPLRWAIAPSRLGGVSSLSRTVLVGAAGTAFAAAMWASLDPAHAGLSLLLLGFALLAAGIAWVD